MAPMPPTPKVLRLPLPLTRGVRRIALLLVAAMVPAAAVGLSATSTSSAAPNTYSLWSSSVVPRSPSAPDSATVEVGTKFTSRQFGRVTGIRFYKSAANTGAHVGSLWDASGRRLASVTFAGESASGWQ